MGRYLIKFSKKDKLKYISHLDLLRVFLRSFKRGNVKLSYSNGYNPHARVSFALPLSLGFESTGEYMEIETEVDYTPEEIRDRVKDVLPPGLSIDFVRHLAETSKTPVAAALNAASYRIDYAPEEDAGQRLKALAGAIPAFMDQAEIKVIRYNRKKKKDVETDIRPRIVSLEAVDSGNDGSMVINTVLHTGSVGNLNAEVMVEELCRFADIPYIRTDFDFIRIEMFSGQDDKLVPLTRFRG